MRLNPHGSALGTAPGAPATARNSAESLRELCSLPDDDFQAHLLAGVSRTFALTIPQLPPSLAKPVSNAYLLCRIVDTIEDEASLPSGPKRRFCRRFADVVAGTADASDLATELSPLLSSSTLPAEHELIAVMPRVIGITHSFDAATRGALLICVKTMAEGMASFQDRDLRGGLANLAELNEYCYYVAGVVGEMLTRLFCLYSPEIAGHHDEMMSLAVSFGQGLQMTNILKDLWDDHERGVCWLPSDLFREAGFELRMLQPRSTNTAFRNAFAQLVGVAHAHLKNALAYTLLIPAHETGIREFCLWALGMALLTLRKINSHLDFFESKQVKISRKAVKATVLTSRLAGRNDRLLRAIFYLVGWSLPTADPALTRLRAREGQTRISVT